MAGNFNFSAPRVWPSAIALVCLIAIGVWFLDAFARAQFTWHLRDHAAHALALAAAGETPFRWRFRESSDLVADRVFDASDYDFDADALTVRSDGKPFEVGLRLMRPVSLRGVGSLHIDGRIEGTGSVQLVVHDRDLARDFSTVPVELSTDRPIATLDLDAWHNAQNEPTSAPTVATMMRLRFSLPRDARFKLIAADLARSPQAPRVDLSGDIPIVDAVSATTVLEIYRLPSKQSAREAMLSSIARMQSDSLLPTLVLLAQSGRVEQQMVAQSKILAALPDAIVIPESAADETLAHAREESMVGAKTPPEIRWISVALLALVLIGARLFPPRNVQLRAFCEVVLTLAGPLWLIIGGHFDGALHKAPIAVMVLTFFYAVSLSTTKIWHWNGSRNAWLLALAVPIVAALIGALFYRADSGIHLLPIKQVVRYAGWALLQQYLLCAICAERWRIVTGQNLLAIYLGAFGFALLHSPNAALMIATFFGGLCWCALYLRERALLPLAASHALSALLLLTLLPRDVLHSAEVSVRFFF